MPHSNDPDFKDSISIIEDLDPEAGSNSQDNRKRELWIGAILLAAVIVFAGWQWWQQDYQAGRYRAGQEAAGRSDWDVAAGYFHEAGEYNDAAHQESNAREQIRQRDSLYKSASELADRGEWLYALNDFRAAARVQPDYLDLEEKEETALQNVYEDALAGTIAMRRAGDTAGLYYRAQAGWVWLEGSDTQSSWQTDDSHKHILFDVPIERGVVEPTQMPEQPRNPGDRFKFRKLVAYTLNGTSFNYMPVALDMPNYFPILVGSDGVWESRIPDSGDLFGDMVEHIFKVVHQPFWSTDLVYRPYTGEIGAAVDVTVTATISTGRVIVAVDPNSEQFLVAEWTGAAAEGPDTDSVLSLFAGRAGSSDRRLIYTLSNAVLESAQFSPDGRSAVVTTISFGGYSEVDVSLDVAMVTVIDLEGDMPPDMLNKTYRPSSLRRESSPIRAAFVREGAHKGKIVVSIYSGDTSYLQLFDSVIIGGNTKQYEAVADIQIEGNIETEWYIRDMGSQGITVAAQLDYLPLYSASVVTSTLYAVVFPASGQPESYITSVDPKNTVERIRTTPERLVWSSSESNRNQQDYVVIRSVYSAQRLRASSSTGGNIVSQAGIEPPTPTFTTRNFDPGRNTANDSLYLGDRLLAYTTEGELHIRTFDGKLDLLLESGVVHLYGENAFNYYGFMLR